MPKPTGGKANVQPIGQTFSGRHGSDPNARVKGGSTTPSEQKFK